MSDIIKELNSKTGKYFDSDVAIKAILQIKDLMLKNRDLVAKDILEIFLKEIYDSLHKKRLI